MSFYSIDSPLPTKNAMSNPHNPTNNVPNGLREVQLFSAPTADRTPLPVELKSPIPVELLASKPPLPRSEANIVCFGVAKSLHLSASVEDHVLREHLLSRPIRLVLQHQPHQRRRRSVRAVAPELIIH